MDVAERLLVAADFDASSRADVRTKVLELADTLAGLGIVIKLNSALRSVGYGLIDDIHDRGLKVFADLKLNDIPNTLSLDGKLLSHSKPEILTVMGSVGVDGLRSLKKQLPQTEVLAVTVLTSLDENGSRAVFGCTPQEGVERFAHMSMEANIDGLILSAGEVELARNIARDTLTYVTPGVRPAWAHVEGDDQSRTATPVQAITAGAQRVVVGRPITGADDVRAAAQRTLAEIAQALEK